MINLRPRQRAAIDALYDYFKVEDGNPLIVAPTGTGKSVIIGAFVQEAMTRFKNQRILMLTHVKELIEQNHEKLLTLWPEAPAGIYCAGLGMKDFDQPIVYASIQSVHKKADLIGFRHLVIVDECFTAETLVATNKGYETIDKVRCGDVVYTATGFAKVVAKSVKTTNIIYKVRLSNGEQIRCTKNHPFLSTAGWVEAEKLEKGDKVFGIQNMSELWRELSSEGSGELCGASVELREKKVLLNILLQEAGERDVGRGGKRKNDSDFKKNWAQTKASWWERQEIAGSTEFLIGDDGRRLDSGVCDKNSRRPLQRGLSELLQGGFGESKTKDSNRAGWKQPQRETSPSGREEGQFPCVIRVEGIEIEKPNGGELVYNLQTDGHPSYFANGVLVHNCHLLSKDSNTMYRRFIKDLQGYNPKLKVIGFTATPYRTKSGMLHMGKDALFTDIAYSINILDELKDGNLSKLVTKESSVQGDNSQLVTVGGEYTNKSMEAAYDTSALTAAVVQECLKHGKNRKAWLFFCTGIKHALHMRDALRDYGIEAQTITGETPAVERAYLIEEFKAGRIRALTNANVLTTGFDYPAIDLIALVRPTKSPGLYVQMVGRGLRVAEGKENCLILDFAGNIDLHGPITHVKPPALRNETKAKKKEEEEKDWKLCKVCGTVNEIDAEVCFDCGTTFVKERKVKHEKEASTAQIISEAPVETDRWYKVNDIKLARHEKNGKVSLRVSYYCGFDKFSEWICLEHDGFALQKAKRWWSQYGERHVESVEEAIFSGIKPISEIRVRTDGKYPEILDRRIKSDAKKMLELQCGSVGHESEQAILQPVAIPSA